MPNEKLVVLEWLLKARGLGSPMITYRGGGMRAMLNLEIPLEEIAEYFETDQLKIAGEVWSRKKNK